MKPFYEVISRVSVLFDGFLAAIAAIGFAVISNPPKKAVFIAALLAAVGHACRYYLLHQTPLDLTSSTLIAAFTIGMGSMWFAKLIHCPGIKKSTLVPKATS